MYVVGILLDAFCVYICCILCIHLSDVFLPQRLMNDVNAREDQLKSVTEKVQVSEVPNSLRQQLTELQCEFERLKSNGETVTRQLTLSFADRQALHNSLHTAKMCIDEKELELRAGKTLPLASEDAKKKLEDIKVAFRIIHYVYKNYVTSCLPFL